MELKKENAYVGAEISKNKETLYILKVNEKSFYASPLKNIVSKWEDRIKGVTFKSFISANFVKKYDYSKDFSISEEVAKLKEEVEKKKERKKTIKRYLKRAEEKNLLKTIAKFSKGKINRAPVSISEKELIYPIVFNKEGLQLLFRKETSYIIFSEEKDEYKLWGELGEIKAKEDNIPWFSEF